MVFKKKLTACIGVSKILIPETWVESSLIKYAISYSRCFSKGWRQCAWNWLRKILWNYFEYFKCTVPLVGVYVDFPLGSQIIFKKSELKNKKRKRNNVKCESKIKVFSPALYKSHFFVHDVQIRENREEFQTLCSEIINMNLVKFEDVKVK